MVNLLKALWNRIVHHQEINFIVHELSHHDGDFNIRLEHPVFTVFAQEMGNMLRRWKAPNFLETTLFDMVTMRKYTVTIQDKTRPTPIEVIRILRAALEDISRADMEEGIDYYSITVHDLAVNALRNVGYLE